jgi:hypothetical protein
MNGSVPALLSAARRALVQTVQPALQDEHARSQLAAIIDLLAKLERLADWSPAVVQEERGALMAAVAKVQATAAAAGVSAPHLNDSQDSVEAARALVRKLSDWAFDEVAPGPVQEQLERELREGLRAAVAAERRHVARTDFSKLTSGVE